MAAEKKSKKTILIIAMVLAAFVLIVSLASLYTERVVSCGIADTCTIPLPFLIPIIASVSLFVGSLTGYFMVERLSKKDVNIKESTELIKKILSKEEFEILKLVAEKQEISQAGIVQKTSIPRLRVFRTIEKLRDRGIVEKEEKDGKMRTIRIREEFKGIF
jgi:uncharacterized membrane protein